MAKGKTRILCAWDRAVEDLQARGSSFRLRRPANSEFIAVRHVLDGITVHQFMVKPYRHDEDADIETVRDLCLQAHARGVWSATENAKGQLDGTTWPEFAAACRQDVERRILKDGSRVHVVNHLTKAIAGFQGPVCGSRLKAWAEEVDPVAEPRQFTRRIDTISQIHKAGLLNLADILEELRGRRPRGAAERIRRASAMRVRVIPSDEEIEAWLDGLDPVNRWVFGMLATYGLRPHEVWHVQEIDEKGWVTVPGEMATKTARHFAPPVPAAWVERFRLRADFEEMRAEVNRRWRIHWTEVSGVRVATNNASISNMLYTQFSLRGLTKLWAAATDGEEKDWARPYDFRHAYAIRCATSDETAHCLDDQMARWMGHGVEVHRRIYLR